MTLKITNLKDHLSTELGKTVNFEMEIERLNN